MQNKSYVLKSKQRAPAKLHACQGFFAILLYLAGLF